STPQPRHSYHSRSWPTMLAAKDLRWVRRASRAASPGVGGCAADVCAVVVMGSLRGRSCRMYRLASAAARGGVDSQGCPARTTAAPTNVMFRHDLSHSGASAVATYQRPLSPGAFTRTPGHG